MATQHHCACGHQWTNDDETKTCPACGAAVAAAVDDDDEYSLAPLDDAPVVAATSPDYSELLDDSGSNEDDLDLSDDIQMDTDLSEDLDLSDDIQLDDELNLGDDIAIDDDIELDAGTQLDAPPPETPAPDQISATTDDDAAPDLDPDTNIAPLDIDDAFEGEAETKIATPSTRCPSCSAENASDATKCSACGKAFNQSADDDSSKDDKSATDKPTLSERLKQRPIQIGIGAGALLLIVAIWFTFFRGGPETAQTPATAPSATPTRTAPAETTPDSTALPTAGETPVLQPKSTLAGAKTAARILTFSTDANYLISAETSKEVILWNVEDSAEKHRWKVEFPITSVGVTSDETLAYALGDSTYSLWDIATGEIVTRPALDAKRENVGLKIVAISPDSKLLLVRGQMKKLGLWDAENGQPLRKLGPSIPTAAAFAPADPICLISSNTETGLYRLDNGELIQKLASADEKQTGATKVAFSHDGGRAVLTIPNAGSKVWDLHQAQIIAELPRDFTTTACLPHPHLVGTYGARQGLVYWDASQKSGVYEDKTPRTTLAFSPNGKLIAAANQNGTIELIHTVLPEEEPLETKPFTIGKSSLVRTFWPQKSDIADIVFSPDGKFGVTIPVRGDLAVWDLATGQQMTTIPPLEGRLLFLPDEKLLRTGKATEVLSLEDGSVTHTFSNATNDLFDLKISDDGSYALAANAKGITRLALPAGEAITLPWQLPFKPTAATVDRNARTAIVGGPKGELMVYDLSTKTTTTLDGHFTPIRQVVLSPNGQTVVSLAGGPEMISVGNAQRPRHNRQVDRAARIWDVARGKEVARLHSRSGEVHEISFLDDQLGLAKSSENVIFDVQTGKRLDVLSTKLGDDIAQQSKTAAGLIFSVHEGGVPALWNLPSPLPSPAAASLPQIDLSTVIDTSSLNQIRMELGATKPSDDPALFAKIHAQRTLQFPGSETSEELLNSTPHTPEFLYARAGAYYKSGMFLESEQCLRALLAADPTHKKARDIYDTLGQKLLYKTGAVIGGPPVAKYDSKLTDAGIPVTPTAGNAIVTLPIHVLANTSESIRIDSLTFHPKSSGPAKFLGVHRPVGKVQGLRRGDKPPSGDLIWETMTVRIFKNQAIVRLQNTRSPEKIPPKPNGVERIRFAAAPAYFEEAPNGPYLAVFEIPAGAKLTSVKLDLGKAVPDQPREGPELVLLSEAPKSFAELAVSQEATAMERSTAIRALGFDPSLQSLTTLQTVMAHGDKPSFLDARDSIRLIYRSVNLIGEHYMPVHAGRSEYAIAMAETPSNSPRVADKATALKLFESRSDAAGSVQSRSTWRFAEPGNYVLRIGYFHTDAQGSAKLKFQQQVAFEITTPGLYWLPTSQATTGSGPRAVEVWLDGELKQREVISANPITAARIAARLPTEKPLKPLPAGSTPPVPDPNKGLLWSAPVLQQPLNVMTASEAQLPLTLRIARNYLTTSLPADKAPIIPSVLAEVARLEIRDQRVRNAAWAQLSKLLGNKLPGLWERLALDADTPVQESALLFIADQATESDAAKEFLDAMPSTPLIEALRKPADEQ